MCSLFNVLQSVPHQNNTPFPNHLLHRNFLTKIINCLHVAKFNGQISISSFPLFLTHLFHSFLSAHFILIVFADYTFCFSFKYRGALWFGFEIIFTNSTYSAMISSCHYDEVTQIYISCPKCSAELQTILVYLYADIPQAPQAQNA